MTKNDDFAGGPWTGFYLYVPGGPKHRMDMDLTFKDGVVTGSGLDDVDRFTIRGRYEVDSHAITWTKAYPTHTVFYRGCREPVGIWGVWELPGTSGGFHIWPRGEGDGAHESVEESAPVDAVKRSRGTR